VKVTESGGFSAAGRRLNLSKAAVSEHVRVLENALGVRLLNRTTRRVSLTEIGRSYYERCLQILHDLEEADEAANAEHATPRGQLRVYCQQAGSPFVAPVVVDFLARYPEVSVDLRTGHATIDLVEEGFDLAITAQPPPEASLVRRHLATTSLIICGAPAYLEKHPAPQSPADLAGHNCLRYPYPPFAEGWHFLDANGNAMLARVSGTLICSSPDTMRAAVAAGIGLAMIPPFMVADLLVSGAVVPVPVMPGYRTQELEINAFYPHRRHLSAKVRAFIDLLAAWFVEHKHLLRPSGSQDLLPQATLSAGKGSFGRS
jgi:DNA-binding transcriptional LysR family regulator